MVNKWDSLYKDEYFSYSRVGRLASYTDPQRREQDYPTDPAGNLVERRSDDQGKTEFIWDGFGRLAQSISKGVITVYRYDAFSRRISKETDGVVSKFYWDGEALVGDELVSSDGISQRLREWTYYPGSFEPLAMWQKDEHGQENSYFYQNMPNGCPERLFDKAGKVVWAVRYNGWALIERVHVQEVDQPLRLQGQFFDEETGNCFNRFRYYDPRIGAFISADPLGLAAGENLYAFGLNTQGWVDPLGLCNKALEKFNNPYAGVKEASEYLKSIGMPRKIRKITLESFDVRTIRVEIAGENTYGLRFHDFGVNAHAKGRYLFETFNPLNNRSNLAVPYEWNKLKGIKQWKVKPGTIIIKGNAAPQLKYGSQYIGGEKQWYINDLNDLLEP